jgi:hypothetical protein
LQDFQLDKRAVKANLPGPNSRQNHVQGLLCHQRFSQDNDTAGRCIPGGSIEDYRDQAVCGSLPSGLA